MGISGRAQTLGAAGFLLNKLILIFQIFLFLVLGFTLRRIRLFFRFGFAEFLARRRGRFANRIENRTFSFFLFLASHTIEKLHEDLRSVTRQPYLLTSAPENFNIGYVLSLYSGEKASDET